MQEDFTWESAPTGLPVVFDPRQRHGLMELVLGARSETTGFASSLVMLSMCHLAKGGAACFSLLQRVVGPACLQVEVHFPGECVTLLAAITILPAAGCRNNTLLAERVG